MSWARLATYFGAFVLAAFVVIVLAYGAYGAGSFVIAGLVLVGLVVAGTRLYGRQSRYGDIAARKRPAQEAHNRAADLAAEARRSTAEAARRGERYCPLDPAQQPDQVATNGHASTAPAAPPSRPH